MGLVAARQDEDVMAEINITPFTDVLLVLLIIFMLLASLVTPPGFQKQLPNKGAPTPVQPQKTKSIDVQVNDAGKIFVDGTPTDERGIYGLLARTVARRGKLHLSLTADVKAPYAVIIRILDAAKSANIADVGFVTS